MRLAIVVLGGAVLCAQSKSPITHSQVWHMKRVGTPVISPDGRWVVVSVTEPSYDPSKQSSDLYLVATTAGPAPKRLTNTRGGESGVAWSPDSKRIAFSARREGDEVPQIYVLPIDGGEAWRLSNTATGASGPVWRPDGKAILYQTDVYRGAESEAENAKAAAARKGRKYSAMAWDSYPIASWDKWVTETHPHPYVQGLEAGAAPVDLLANTRLIRGSGFAANGTGDGGEDLDPKWSPDGKWVVFVATTDRDQVTHSLTTNHLFRVAAEGGEPEAITSGVDSYEAPQFSSDGATLFATHSPGGEQRLYSHNRVVAIDWPKMGAPRNLVSGLDRPINGYRAHHESIYLSVEDHGREHVYRVAASGGVPRPVAKAATGMYSSVAVGGEKAAPVVVANWQSMNHPPEVVRVAESGKHANLTNFTDPQLKGIDWQAPREFWTKARNGKQIHSFLVLPPGLDERKKYPLLVFMHGGPHQPWKDQWFLRWNYQLLASPGYAVLMTNYTGSPGYGEQFAADINKDVLRGPANEINDAADEALRQFPFLDAARQAAGGASYGGYLANWMEGTTTRYKVLFSHAGLTNNESMWGATDGGYYWELRYGGPVWEAKGQWQEQNPLRYAANFQTPMLVTHGALDLRVPLGQGLEMFKLLQRKKVPSRLVYFPDENHWILKGENARYFFDELFGWLKKHL